MKVRQKYLRSGQFRTNILETGRVGAPVLFLLHDGALGGGARVSWEDLIAELEADFHIFAPDFYGFGESDMLFHFGLRPYESHIQQIAALTEALGLEDVHFVGTSYGGSVLMRAAAQDPLPWPMRSGITISGAGGLFRHNEGKKKLAAIEPALESIRSCLRLLVSDSWARFDQNAELRHQNSIRPGHWEALYSPRLKSPARKAETSDTTFPASLSKCPVPVLLIEGLKDPLLEKGWAAQMATHLPKAEVVQLDTSHSPNLDHASLIADLIRKFVLQRDEMPRRGTASHRQRSTPDRPGPNRPSA